MDNTDYFKRDISYLSIALLILSVIPIIAGIQAQQTWLYFIIPFAFSAYLIAKIKYAYDRYKESQYQWKIKS